MTDSEMILMFVIVVVSILVGFSMGVYKRDDK